MLEDVILGSILVAAAGTGVFLAVKTDLSRASYLRIALIIAVLGLQSCLAVGVLALRYLKNETLFHATAYPGYLCIAVFVACLTAGVTILVRPRKSTRRFGLVLVAGALSPIPLSFVTSWAFRWVVAAFTG